MSFDFSTNFKEKSIEIGEDAITNIYTCSILEFADKVVLSIAKNGEIDVTYDIQTPSFSDLKRPQRKYIFDEENEGGEYGELNNGIVPKLLIGISNLKIQVIASQIGLLLSTLTSKNIILNLSGKTFGSKQSEEYNKSDFKVLHELLALVKETYAKN